MTGPRPGCRICLVTPPAFEPAAFSSVLARALGCADIAAVRLRMPAASPDALSRAASALLEITQRADVAFLLDGDPALAHSLGCDGVHVPARMVAAARRIIPEDSGSVGAACGASRDAAMQAAEAGADYVAFGPTIGPDAIAPETPADWALAMVVPCVVGGGITLDTVSGWVATGAEFLALGRCIWDASEGPEAALRAIAARLNRD